MSRQSAGILLYRVRAGAIEVFLVHPGGPFWSRKDDGAWSIPKGEFAEGEDPSTVALREFREETGFEVRGEGRALKPVRQPGGKTVYVWLMRGNLDAEAIRSNSFTMEWPRGSGKMREFPEVDRAGWFPVAIARRKILKGQAGFLDQFEEIIKTSEPRE